MKKTFTIAHHSDIHLSPDYFPERSSHFRSILSLCKQRQVDHIIITGDITNQAKENEFDHFRKILREFSMLDSKKITVINGNHDIFGGQYYAEDVLSFPINPVTTYAIEQNYPNPFNPTTTINYQIPKDGNVTIKVFDALGREVTTLVNEYKSTGRYSVEFDASRLSSRISSKGGYASGVYFYSIKSRPKDGGQAEEYKAVKKMSLIKYVQMKKFIWLTIGSFW